MSKKVLCGTCTLIKTIEPETKQCNVEHRLLSRKTMCKTKKPDLDKLKALFHNLSEILKRFTY